MSSSSHADRPERSRNAKAQARHRAKRKAYIEQLEQTVTKLQQAAGYTPEQLNAMPPPLLKIRDLEQENARLEKENEELRRLLTDSTSPHSRFSSETLRRPSLSPYADFRPDRDYKRRKPIHQEDLYLSPNDPQHHGNELSLSRPPPLSIPQPVSHQYGSLGSGSTNHHQHPPLFNLPNPGFQMPNTPSGSSATSSPPFSPVQLQPPLQPSIDHRSHLVDHHAIPNNYTHSGHYASVKVEDDHYMPTHHHGIQYPYSQNHNHGQTGIDWHTGYSSERGHLR